MMNMLFHSLSLPLSLHALFIASRVNDTTTKVSQQEIVFPVRPESNIVPERERNGPNAIPHERTKGTLIGGGHSFTDMPPNEYGIFSEGDFLALFY